MKTRVLVACIAAVFAMSLAVAQTKVDRSFTSVDKDCSGVNWSQDALTAYPKIASACQGIQERDGKTYVKFAGKVEHNYNHGEKVAIKFKDGDNLTLAPPANMQLYVDGKLKTARDLSRGDELSFYVPEDQLVQTFAATMSATTQPAGQSAAPERLARELPSTASYLPLLAVGGLLLILAAAGFSVRRTMRR